MSNGRHIFQVHVGAFSNFYEALSIEASKKTMAEDIVQCVLEKLGIVDGHNFELAEVAYDSKGKICKVRRLLNDEFPISRQLQWPSQPSDASPRYRFCLCEKNSMPTNLLEAKNITDPPPQEYFLRFLYQPKDKEYSDLCQLPNLTEQTLLENLKARFAKGHIYTYVGSILIAVNPFIFRPIYNPKYVKLYQRRALGDLPPHIFAIADATYQRMLREKHNQCIVISGESGSGKTESTHHLLHQLTSLSHKAGHHDIGVEQTILSASPVLEAFGNAKTKHNNNSSRFGKFIQVNYKENGQVHGAIVQKYLLEKSRIVSHARNERNYHVFYFLLMGAGPSERESLHLTHPRDYHYLNQSQCYTVSGMDDAHEYRRLRQSMEMVGFSAHKQEKVFGILAAVLHLGNVEFIKKSSYHSDEAVDIRNPEVVAFISKLLGVKEAVLSAALTCKHAKAKEEMITFHYKMPEAVATRDAMAKCLYGALFDWIVMQVNYALLAKQESYDHVGQSIHVLDIFGFEDFSHHNSFEQFCINFANEHLQYYFNQHVFKYEQEEYQREGIVWQNIEFTDNTGCLELMAGRPHGLLCLLDDQCSFPGATDDTLLQKFEHHHKNNPFYEMPLCRENAFLVNHYAGKVKYNIKDFREKNLDLMRPDVVSLLKNSQLGLVRELVGGDPVAAFRWQILRATLQAASAFSALKYGKKHEKYFKENSYTHHRHSSSRERASPLVRPPPYLLQPQCLGAVLCASEASVLNLANQILLKKRYSKTKANKKEWSLNSLQTVQQIIGKVQYRTAKKQSPTVGTQFQISLNQLMDALNHANPFFVRCIKSNEDKVPNKFDEAIILQQLRYTGMLETVRIRRSGYSVRFAFEEFIQSYRILLPRGLLSSRADVASFLSSRQGGGYQVGRTKVFLRESEKQALDGLLHDTILHHIIRLQSYVRTWLQKRKFLHLRRVALGLQYYSRKYLTAQLRHQAAVIIQRAWRRYLTRHPYHFILRRIVTLQAFCRGYLARKRCRKMWVKQRVFIHPPARRSLSQDASRYREGETGACRTTYTMMPLKHSLSSAKPISRSKSSENVNNNPSIDLKPDLRTDEESFPKGKFKKAKKHLKTFIGNKKEKKEGMNDFSDDSGPDDPSLSEDGGWRSEKPSPKTSVTGSSWHVTRTSEFQDPSDILITDVSELKNMDSFIFKKLCQINEKRSRSKDSNVDMVFKKALQAFKSNLISTFSVAQQDGGNLSIRYKDLIDHFEHVMATVCQREGCGTFPLTVGLNAFRGFLDEFRASYRTQNKPNKNKKRKRKKKNRNQVPIVKHLEHQFICTTVNIFTICEMCSTSLWLMERGLECQGCKLTCHKKCLSKVNSTCPKVTRLSNKMNKVFGVPLESLVDEEHRVPSIVERLITAIELRGLYSEGLYRKSGITSKVARLRDALESAASTSGHNDVMIDLDAFPVHVLATVLKSFFRELPEPLLIYDLYCHFLHAADVENEGERMETLFSLIHRLPPAHYDLLERLVFHLARVAQQEESNRMSVGALAIVWAPCMLRPPPGRYGSRVQDTLQDIGRQTLCVATIVGRQLKRVRATLDDITTLDVACHTAASRLTSLRSSRMLADSHHHQEEEAKEQILTSHIATLQNEKALLTTALPALSSDDDLLSTESTSVDDLSMATPSTRPRPPSIAGGRGPFPFHDDPHDAVLV